MYVHIKEAKVIKSLHKIHEKKMKILIQRRLLSRHVNVKSYSETVG